MTTAPLILTQQVIDALHGLHATAVRTPVDMPTLLRTIKTPQGKRRHAAQMQLQTIEIPGPWRFMVTFSIETGHPAGICRHMSMSIARDGRVPHPAALWLIATHLGFTGGLEACQTWPEPLQGHGVAINMVQPMAN